MTTLNEAIPRSWTTASELDFVDNMASGKHGIKKLRGYLVGMNRRVDFGSMNVHEVLVYAREKLALLERREDARGVAL